MRRFRPNLVITGSGDYAEDAWRRITIGDIGFRLPKPCSRCIVTTVDPDSATYGKEPLKTLKRLRMLNNKVYFGKNAVHDNPGSLTVGDAVRINEIGPPQPNLV